jgi:acetyl-CoA carboxylase biotin carboxyl carrier protein
MPEKKELDLEALKEIIKIMKENDLSEICVEQNGLKIQVKQGQPQIAHSVYSVPVQTINEQAETSVTTEIPADSSVFITAPILGTFYESPKPGEKPYVKVGDNVTAGQVIYIIEAMKIMNEITADWNCEILEILVNNGESVDYEKPIFRVKLKA